MSIIWDVVFWTTTEDGKGPVWKWLEELHNDQKEAVIRKLSLLELCGHTLRMPSSRALGGGLFELRETGFGLRVYYGFFAGRIIVLVAAGDKKSQTRDIALARKRLEMALKEDL